MRLLLLLFLAFSCCLMQPSMAEVGLVRGLETAAHHHNSTGEQFRAPPPPPPPSSTAAGSTG